MIPLPMPNKMLTPRAVAIKIDVGPAPANLWDGVGKAWTRREVRTARLEFSLPPDTAAVVTIVPAKAKVESARRRLLVDGVVVDFNGWRPTILSAPR